MGNEVLTGLNDVLTDGILVNSVLNSGDSVKILVTVDDAGTPHPAVKNSLRAGEGGIVYLEFLESSRANRYMTRSLWFDKAVVILVVAPGGKSYKITALPVKAIVNGKIFQAYYEEARDIYGLDLSTVWVLRPLHISEETLHKRAEEEGNSRPYFLHLDRLAKIDRPAKADGLAAGKEEAE